MWETIIGTSHNRRTLYNIYFGGYTMRGSNNTIYNKCIICSIAINIDQQVCEEHKAQFGNELVRKNNCSIQIDALGRYFIYNHEAK